MTRPWTSPELTSWGRLPMHGVRHPDRVSLDGTWRFQLLPHPEAALADAWRDISVPTAWTMQDTGDLPHYTNIQMPWALEPPHIPDANPTGVYRRTFTIPPAWQGRRVVLSVGAAESVLLAKLNGRDVGVGKDSHLASEFDVTDHLRPGDNELELRVVKWSDATWVEDQDQWWHGGITRPVTLYATHPVHLADVSAIPGLEADGTGTLDLDVRIEFGAAGPQPGWRVEARLSDLGEPLAADVPVPVPQKTRRSFDDELAGLQGRVSSGSPLTAADRAAWESLRDWLVPPPVGLVRWQVRVPRARAWSAEEPNLSDLEIALLGPDGSRVEECRLRVGYRSVEIRGNDLLLNGRRTYIRGVNRHDFDPKTGRTVTRDQMRADLVQMKRFGFNALRTSHYPNDPALLDLADELGLWVIAEADIESHAVWGTLCDDPCYLDAWVDRVSRMVLRDRSHPSVFAWSLGNESGHGANHEAAAAWVRRVDPSRILHYEGAIRFDWTSDQHVSDLTCPMYPPISAIAEHATNGTQRHPLIMCEYAHAMGNSCGTLGEYWDAIESIPGLQGGFIWEWWDHGLEQRLPDGTVRWAYGGDFGDTPHDGTFVCDGLNWPDRTPKPAMWEHKQIASPVRLAAAGTDLLAGRVGLANRRDVRDLSWLVGRWEVADDGAVVAAGDVRLPSIGPGSTGTADLLGWASLAAPGQRERWLTLSFSTALESGWAPAGFEVGFAQVRLDDGGARGSAGGDGPGHPVGAVDPVEVDDKGRLVHPLLSAAPALALWRAPTDNDRIPGLGARWAAWGLDRLERRLLGIEREGGATVVTADIVTGSGEVVRHVQRFLPLPEGGVRVEEEATIPEALTDLPRVGTVMEVVPGFEQLEWFGNGPHETYPDRARGGRIGRWRSTVTEQHVPYIRPQENGGHAGVRWLELADRGGRRFRVALDEPRQVSVTHFRAADLDAATHFGELRPRTETVIHLDARHRGVGVGSCGPDTLPQYRFGPGTYRWSWAVNASGWHG